MSQASKNPTLPPIGISSKNAINLAKKHVTTPLPQRSSKRLSNTNNNDVKDNDITHISNNMNKMSSIHEEHPNNLPNTNPHNNYLMNMTSKSINNHEININDTNDDNDTSYSSDEEYTPSTTSQSFELDQNKSNNNNDNMNPNLSSGITQVSEHPYIEEDDEFDELDLDDNSYSSSPHPDPTTIATNNSKSRYSTAIARYIKNDSPIPTSSNNNNDNNDNTQLLPLTSNNTVNTQKKVSFAINDDQINKKKEKNVSFAINTHINANNSKKDVRFALINEDDDDNDNDIDDDIDGYSTDIHTDSSMSSQDILDDLFDNKLHTEHIDHIEDIHSLNINVSDIHNDIHIPSNIARKSKFLKFGENFFQTALNISAKYLPKTPLPGSNPNNTDFNSDNNIDFGNDNSDIDDDISFSATASTIDFDPFLWKRVSDRSYSTDDSIDEKEKRKRKKIYKKKNKHKKLKEKLLKKSNQTSSIDDYIKYNPDTHNTHNDDLFDDEEDLNDSVDSDDTDDDDTGDDDDDDDGYSSSNSSDPDWSDIMDNNHYINDGKRSSQSYDDNNSHNNKLNRGDRMWFRHQMGHLKVLKKFFHEMDKDKGGTIDYDEFTKFLRKYGIDKLFKPSELERFFLKITAINFNPDHPNEYESKFNNTSISPTLLEHAQSSTLTTATATATATSNSIDYDLINKKSNFPKKTSIFFGKKTKFNQPQGEVDIGTFLFYFSSPIDSSVQTQTHQLLNTNNYNDMSFITNTNTNTTQSVILPQHIPSNPLSTAFSRNAKLAANAAQKRNHKKHHHNDNNAANPIDAVNDNDDDNDADNDNDNIDLFIDPSLKLVTNQMFNNKNKNQNKNNSKYQQKRHSLMTPSNTHKKLKKRKNSKNGNFNKRGSISNLRSYHFQKKNKNNKQIMYNNDDNDNDNGITKSITVPRQEDIDKINNNNGSGSGLSAISSLLVSDNLNIKISSNNDYELIINMMKKSLLKQDRNKLKDCFIGRDAVTFFLSKNLVNSRHAGLLLGRKLIKNNYIKYASDNTPIARDFEDEIRFFYQFTNKTDQQQQPQQPSFANPPPVLKSVESNDTNASVNTPVPQLSNNITDLSSNNNNNNDDDTSSQTQTTTTNSTQTQTPVDNNYEYQYSSAQLTLIINQMLKSIEKTSPRSYILAKKSDIYSGREITEWLIKYKYCNNTTESELFGSYLRDVGIIQHIEYEPVFLNNDDYFYTIGNTVNKSSPIKMNKISNNNNNNNNIRSTIDPYHHVSTSSKNNNNNRSASLRTKTQKQQQQQVILNNNNNKKMVILEDETASRTSRDISLNMMRNKIKRSKNDSIASNITIQSDYTNTDGKRKTSLVLGQHGHGKKARINKRRKVIQELFPLIIRSQISHDTRNLPTQSLLHLDMIMDGGDHPHIQKLLNKIHRKFSKCDTLNRDALNLLEFNKFLIKCGIYLHNEDLNVIFRIFDKNSTGLIDYSNFSDNSLVHRVPGIATNNLTITHLIKHTISVNFATMNKNNKNQNKNIDDNYTKIADSIAKAFEEINTSNTGEITLNEFKLAFTICGLDVFRGVKQIFNKLCSNGNNYITLNDFTEAFQANLYMHKQKPPTLREVLQQAQLLQFEMFPTNNNINNNNSINLMDDYYEIEDSNITQQSGINPNNSNNILNVITPQTNKSSQTQSSNDNDNDNDFNVLQQSQATNDKILPDNILPEPVNDNNNNMSPISEENNNNNMIGKPLRSVNESTTLKNSNNNNNHKSSYSTDSVLTDKSTLYRNNINKISSLQMTKIDISDLQLASGDFSEEELHDGGTKLTRKDRSLTADVALKSPHPRVRTSHRKAIHKIWNMFLKPTIIISLPGVIINCLLYFLSAIPIDSNSRFPIADLTWYIFGFLVYIALQSTMVGDDTTKSLFLFDVIVASIIGTILVITTLLDIVLSFDLIITSEFLITLIERGAIWWLGYIIVTFICECVARIKFKHFLPTPSTKREIVLYALIKATGVSIFWFIQTIIAVIVVNISCHNNNWFIILYCIITQIVFRNISLNLLGTTFINKLSDHYLLEDVEIMDLKIDELLLTQLSIIASYSPLWWLFTKTSMINDWYYIFSGIILYQLIFLLLDKYLNKYLNIRNKTIPILRGELIAWFIAGSRALMQFLYPIPIPKIIDNYYDRSFTTSPYYYTIFISIFCYICGPILLLFLLYIRVHKIWTFNNVEFAFPEIDDNESNKINKKQRYRFILICTCTMGFIVSVTDVVSTWSDNTKTTEYEGFFQL